MAAANSSKGKKKKWSKGKMKEKVNNQVLMDQVRKIRVPALCLS